MNTATNNRLIVTKSILWFLTGAAFIAGVVRFTRGLGATTALTDITPWGLWIGLDVLAGVALAAGGFVLAATVHILGRERYHALVKPAILTAFLGYLAVIFGLMVDLGRPWNIWRPLFFQNLHSPLFEVAMCVMAYTGVLALEFAPTGLDRFGWAKPIVSLLRRMTLPLVILGIALSTLHQSSLGTLFLLTEGRMHDLWYSPLMPLLFLISAIALGFAMVTLESMVSSWLYRKEGEWEAIGGLIRAAAVVLAVYLVIRLGDLAVRGVLAEAFDGSWFATLFWIELSMIAIVPIVLFALPRSRGTRWATAWSAALIVGGLILNRADVGGIAHIAVTGQAYVPALSEIVLSLGVMSVLGLVFLFFVEKLRVWEEPPAAPDHFTPPAIDPVTSHFVRAPWFGGGQRAALAVITGMVAGIGLMEYQLASRAEPKPEPIESPRAVFAAAEPREGGPGHLLRLIDTGGGPAAPAGDSCGTGLLIDGGRSGQFVLFMHEAHQRRLGGQESCEKCHHRNVPMDRGTSCSACHADMYRITDTFDHERHAGAYESEGSCAVCHVDAADPKTRRVASSDCDRCHVPIAAEQTRVHPAAGLEPGMAVGYKRAMHTLCIDCHREHEAETAAAAAAAGSGGPGEKPSDYLTQCSTCHGTGIPARIDVPAPPVKTEMVNAATGLVARGGPAGDDGTGRN